MLQVVSRSKSGLGMLRGLAEKALILGTVLCLVPAVGHAQSGGRVQSVAMFLKIKFDDGNIARGSIAANKWVSTVNVFDNSTGESIRLKGWTWTVEDLDGDGDEDDIVIMAGGQQMWLIDREGSSGEAFDPLQGQSLGSWSAW